MGGDPPAVVNRCILGAGSLVEALGNPGLYLPVSTSFCRFLPDYCGGVEFEGDCTCFQQKAAKLTAKFLTTTTRKSEKLMARVYEEQTVVMLEVRAEMVSSKARGTGHAWG